MYSETQKGAEQGLTRGGASGRECSQKLGTDGAGLASQEGGAAGGCGFLSGGGPQYCACGLGSLSLGKGLPGLREVECGD